MTFRVTPLRDAFIVGIGGIVCFRFCLILFDFCAVPRRTDGSGAAFRQRHEAFRVTFRVTPLNCADSEQHRPKIGSVDEHRFNHVGDGGEPHSVTARSIRTVTPSPVVTQRADTNSQWLSSSTAPTLTSRSFNGLIRLSMSRRRLSGRLA